MTVAARIADLRSKGLSEATIAKVLAHNGWTKPVPAASAATCCAECGRGGAVISAADSSGIVAKVCRSCARKPAHARSYC